ncbi:type IV pilus assembly protein PilM [Thermovibrio sp.]
MSWLERLIKGDSYLYPGIDIGTYSIKVVQSKKKRNRYTLKTFGIREYKEQAFAGTEIVDEIEITRTLKELLEELKIKDKKASIHIPLNSCFYSVISIPKSKDPEEAVSEYMKSIIQPEEFSKIKIDYRILPISIEKEHTDIAIAAVKNEVIEKRAKLLKQLKLEPTVIDIEPATINNQYYLNNPQKVAVPVCLIDIGATFTKIIISFGGYPYITRNIELGGNNLTESIQKEFMLTREEAENLKFSYKEKVSEDKLKEIVFNFLKRISTEALWTIESFKDRFNLDVEEIILYGGTSKLNGIEDTLKTLTKFKVKKGYPLSFSGIEGYEEFAVAAGLSIRNKGDEDAKV